MSIPIASSMFPAPAPAPPLPPAAENRDAWLDWCRFFAILSVVFTHSVDKFFPLFPPGVRESFTASQRIAAVLGNTLGGLGVPVFLFLSGYLLPNRYAATSPGDYADFVRKKWLPLFLCVELWYVVYVVLMSLAGQCSFSLRFLASCMTFSSHPPLNHVWYMEMILGLYFLLPLLGLAKTVFGKRAIFILFAASMFVHFVRPLFQICWLDLSFLGDCYILYVLFGYCVFLSKDLLKTFFSCKPLYALSLLLFAANIALCVYRQNQADPLGVLRYDTLSFMPAAMLFPLLLLPLRNWRNPLVEYIGIHAFAIYLMHNLVLTLFRDHFSSIGSRGWRISCAWLAGVAVPLLFALALSKFPRLKQWLFLVKPRRK